jgi:hypothetical protein
MSDGREVARRPARAPLRQRTRRRWAIAGGVALCWALAELMTRSAITATVLLMVVAGLCVATVAGLRAMGITRDHPWVRRMASRPWRDGWDVLNAAVRHLSDVFVITPSGSLLAPNVVEIQLNPDDLMSVRERMELDVIGESVTQVYEEQVAARGARFAGPDRADVYVVPDESVPPGRYRLRQGVPVTAGAAFGQYAPPGPEYPPDAEYTRVDYPSPGGSGRSDGQPGGGVTVMEQTRPAIPVLRLVTGSSVAETVMSGARAGRGPVELVLPDVPTISREHARFTFSEGRWWVSNQGRNGICLNGASVTGEQPLSDGDSIRWGSRRDAPQSRVKIG